MIHDSLRHNHYEVLCFIFLLLLVSLPVSSNLLHYDIFDLNYPDPFANIRRQLTVQLDVFNTPYSKQAKTVCDALIVEGLRSDYHYHYCMSGMIQSLRWRSMFAISDTCFIADGKYDDFVYALTHIFEMDSHEKGLTACLVGEPSSHVLVPAIMSPHVEQVHIFVPRDDEEAIDKEDALERWNLSIAERLSINAQKPMLLSLHLPQIERVGGYVDPLTGQVKPVSLETKIKLSSKYNGICDVVIINEEHLLEKEDPLQQERQIELHRQIVEVIANGSPDNASVDEKESNHNGDTSMSKRRKKKTTRVIQLKSGKMHDQVIKLFSSPTVESTMPSNHVEWLMTSTWFYKSYFYHHNDSNGFVARTYGLPTVMNEKTLTTSHLGLVHHYYPNEDDGGAKNQQRQQKCAFTNPHQQLFIVINYNLRVFAETAFGLQLQLKSLGYRHVQVLHDFSLYSTSFVQSVMTKVCGSKMLQISLDPHDLQVFSKYFIAYHMEQPWSNITFGWGTHRYGHVLSKALRVWSFSPLQVELFTNATANEAFLSRYAAIELQMPLLPPSKIDYVPLYTTDPKRRGKALQPYSTGQPHSMEGQDVLFFGSGSPRRAPMLETLIRRFHHEVNVTFRIFTGSWNSTVFDLDRDIVVFMAKVVFNINNGEDSVLEAHRLNYLLSMGKCIVSERGIDSKLASRYEGAVVFVDSLEDLFEKTVYYAKHDEERRLMEELALQRHYELQKDQSALIVAMDNVVRDLSNLDH